RLDSDLSLNSGDQIDGQLAGAASGAVGHGDERRPQRGQLADGIDQALDVFRLFSGEELEGEHMLPGLEAVADLHFISLNQSAGFFLRSEPGYLPAKCHTRSSVQSSRRMQRRPLQAAAQHLWEDSHVTLIQR